MKTYMKPLLWGTLYLYTFFYLFIYLAFICIIVIAHSSYSIVSVLAVSIPFIILLLFRRVMFKLALSDEQEIYRKKLKSITVVGAALFTVCIIQLGGNEYQSRFHQETWLKNDGKRVYMIDDLLAKHKLVGTSKEEVITLLGTPTEIRQFETVHQMIYYLGTEGGFIPIDSECLILYLNHNDRIIDYRIETD
ncbi:conserved hypothetical protein [Bacillus cytotoxicus NVH 391-98]|uniref:Outer membrane protein assembly factor BamE n=2 Tax=Bacillus TaxID=1386 RepID=A7GR18_BACCN|nr:conserved hypothetical protein [Bacillus cytotoxicus NVH 391-98]AWC45219.1 hypothetical protein CG479_012505 [Bacillus cytotoxicus]